MCNSVVNEAIWRVGMGRFRPEKGFFSAYLPEICPYFLHARKKSDSRCPHFASFLSISAAVGRDKEGPGRGCSSSSPPRSGCRAWFWGRLCRLFRVKSGWAGGGGGSASLDTNFHVLPTKSSVGHRFAGARARRNQMKLCTYTDAPGRARARTHAWSLVCTYADC